MVPRLLCLLHLFIIYQNINSPKTVSPNRCTPNNMRHYATMVKVCHANFSLAIYGLWHQHSADILALQTTIGFTSAKPLQDQYSNTLRMPIQFPSEIPLSLVGNPLLRSRYGIGQTIIFLPCDFYLSFSSFFFLA